MLYVCVRNVMVIVFSVCIMKHGAVGARVCEVPEFWHADVGCLCLVCILWQFSMLFVNAGRGCKRRQCGGGILQSRSHDCLVGSHECLLLFTPSWCSECFYHL